MRSRPPSASSSTRSRSRWGARTTWRRARSGRTARSNRARRRTRSSSAPAGPRRGAAPPNGDLAGIGVLFGLRFGLDLYANVRPTKLYPNVRHKVHDGFKQVWEPGKVDFVIVRENTEGIYPQTRG